ncbi:30S ribosomal protein S6 [Spirochaetota bacterium]
MNHYELVVILKKKNAESLYGKVKGILEKHEVSIASEDEWGLKRLAYQIDNENEGHYYLLNIDAPPLSVKKIISEFKLDRDIMRYLFVKTKAKKSA